MNTHHTECTLDELGFIQIAMNKVLAAVESLPVMIPS